MITCSSCKNKTSSDRCPNKAMKGLLFCGKHIRSTRLWKDVNCLDDKAILIQKTWRGYTVRNWIKLCGLGALSRAVCHNEEELVTLDSKTSVHPLNYFSFEEDGKVYWFDIRSIAEHCIGHLKPTNPYTRSELSFDTRRRLRTLCVKRNRLKIPNEHDAEKKRLISDVILHGWTAVCQIVEENGFFDLNPMHFISLSRPRLFVLNNLIHQDMIALAAEHKVGSRRHVYVNWMKRLMREYARGIEDIRYLYLTSKVLVAILNDSKDQYSYCFILMSALARL